MDALLTSEPGAALSNSASEQLRNVVFALRSSLGGRQSTRLSEGDEATIWGITCDLWVGLHILPHGLLPLEAVRTLTLLAVGMDTAAVFPDMHALRASDVPPVVLALLPLMDIYFYLLCRTLRLSVTIMRQLKPAGPIWSCGRLPGDVGTRRYRSD